MEEKLIDLKGRMAEENEVELNKIKTDYDGDIGSLKD